VRSEYNIVALLGRHREPLPVQKRIGSAALQQKSAQTPANPAAPLYLLVLVEFLGDEVLVLETGVDLKRKRVTSRTRHAATSHLHGVLQEAIKL
jgi:hypothetical protein